MFRALWLSGLYVLGAWYAGVFIRTPEDVTLFWPAAGVAYAAVIRYGARWALFIPPAVLAAHLFLLPVPPLFLPFSVFSNLLGTLAGERIFRLMSEEGARISVRSGLALVSGAAVASFVSAAIGVLGLLFAGVAPTGGFWQAFAQWSASDLLGLSSVAPSILLLTASRPRRVAARVVDGEATSSEHALWLIIAALLAALFYLLVSHDSLYALGATTLPLAMLVWSALRFSPAWTIFGTGLVVVTLVSLTGLGLAGFRAPVDPLDATLLLVFLCLFSFIPLMLLAAVVGQRVASRRALLRATTDAATGLPNRTAFVDGLARTLQSRDAIGGVVSLDLDHLSVVNDDAGHAAGNAVILAVGSLLRSLVGEDGQVFRIGGDEFALVLSGDIDAVAQKAEAARAAIERYRVGWQDRGLNVTASVGVAPFAGGRTALPDLLSLADSACFAAKELGGNRICVAGRSPGELEARNEAMRWAARIREALEHGWFELYCQAISPLGDVQQGGRTIEVLLRMRDPDTGQMLAPGVFIPAAERFHLGVRLDRHVIELALGWFERRPDAVAGLRRCAINLTAASMVDDQFRRFLLDRVRRSSVPAHKLCFEITENSAVRDLAEAQSLIAQLRALGCAFALDDFGTGFCSFNYLRSLDVDYFKIDGSFVRGLEDSALSTAIVRSITDIAHVLDKHTIAEHVESATLCATLRALGVDFAQGFALHHPEPLDTFFAPRGAPLAFAPPGDQVAQT
ncbi:MAG: EAL domain-containing protein [Xanthomonadales bacterium]|nr:EAL domain-containing protein [Xanthomonadales bacterium]